MRRPGYNPWVGKFPWRREWQPTPGFLSGGSRRQRSPVGWQSWTQLSNKTRKYHIPKERENEKEEEEMGDVKERKKRLGTVGKENVKQKKI